ncbi:MAG: type VI secretion system tube protein Hcp [Proteobacteria bacterium]|nr:type VI secretion system tube protein Hcp [Pseudomonadota bacterium]
MATLTVPNPSFLLNQTLTEASNFASTLEDPDLPAAIKKVIALSNKDEGINEAPSILMTIANIPGVSKAGSISKAIEVYGFSFAARRKSVEGKDGQLQASGNVIVEDLIVVCPDDAYVETGIQSICTGANVGNVSLYFLRNIGTTAQIDSQIDLTNCRLSSFYENQYVSTMGFGFDTIKVTYFPVADTGTASGKVSAGFDLTTNAPVK